MVTDACAALHFAHDEARASMYAGGDSSTLRLRNRSAKQPPIAASERNPRSCRSCVRGVTMDIDWPASSDLQHLVIDWQASQPSTSQALRDSSTLVVIHHAFEHEHVALCLVATHADVTVRDLKRYISRSERDGRRFASLEALEVVVLQKGSHSASDSSTLRSLAQLSEDPLLSSFGSSDGQHVARVALRRKGETIWNDWQQRRSQVHRITRETAYGHTLEVSTSGGAQPAWVGALLFGRSESESAQPSTSAAPAIPSAGVLPQLSTSHATASYVSQISLIDARALLERQLATSQNMPAGQRRQNEAYWQRALDLFDRVYPPSPDGPQPAPTSDFTSYGALLAIFAQVAANPHQARDRDQYAVFGDLLYKLGWTSRITFIANLKALEQYLLIRIAHERDALGLPLAASSVELDAAFASNDSTVEAEVDTLFKGLDLMRLVRGQDDPLPDAAKGAAPTGRVQYIAYVRRRGDADPHSGKPYWLSTPPPVDANSSLRLSLRRHEDQLRVVHTLLAITQGMPSGGLKASGTTTSTANAPNRGPVTPQVAAARQMLQNMIGPAGAPAGPNGQPAHGFALVINLSEILAIAAPLCILALKLGFMLYVFGRHASPTKRYLLVSLCVLYVIYEGFSIRRRRVAAVARQQDAAAQAARREARRAQDNAAGDAAAQPEARNGAAAGERAPVRARGRRGLRATTPASKWTVKYWANLVAHVGLEAEARDMGIAVSPPTPGAPVPAGVTTGPATIYAGRVMPARQPSRLQRIGHAVYVGTVLFIATLVPEVEKRRKRALDRRERLRSQLQIAREQALARVQETEQQTAAEAGTSTATASETLTVPDAARADTPQPDQPPEAALFEDPQEAQVEPGPAQAADDSSDGEEAVQAAGDVDEVGADLFVIG